MASLDDQLALISPKYRKCMQELREIRSAFGALECAYRNALNDAIRAKGELNAAEDTLRTTAESLSKEADRILHKVRDDPGVNGSGR